MKKIILVACGAVAAMVAGTAQATVQEDVSLCRTAFADKTGKSLDGYRLRFEKTKGRRVRTLDLIAIPNNKSSGNKFRFTCVINRGEVSDIAFNTKDS